MTDINVEAMLADLIRDEEPRQFVYDDATGKPLKKGDTIQGHPTVAIGRALDVKGINFEEQKYLCRNDIAEVDAALAKVTPLYAQVDEIRRRVLCNMAFNMGVSGLMDFQKMWAAIADKDWVTAAAEMTDSAWAKQVGARATRLTTQMVTGQPVEA